MLTSLASSSILSIFRLRLFALSASTAAAIGELSARDSNAYTAEAKPEEKKPQGQLVVAS
jgi:hypothetical protein